MLDRLVWLDDHRAPVAAAAPVLLVDPLEYDKHMERICAMLVDFPLSMVLEDHVQRAGSFDAQITFARDRMKATLAQSESDMREVLLDVMRPHLKAEYMKLSRKVANDVNRPLTEAELLHIHRAVHNLVIKQPCTPLVTLDHFIQMWEIGVISHQQLADHAAHDAGMQPEEMEAKHPSSATVSARVSNTDWWWVIGDSAQATARARDGADHAGQEAGHGPARH